MLGRLNAKTFRERTDQAVANLKTLADDDPLKTAMLPVLEKELAEFKQADVAEDITRANFKSGRMALVLYKAELSQDRGRPCNGLQSPPRIPSWPLTRRVGLGQSPTAVRSRGDAALKNLT